MQRTLDADIQFLEGDMAEPLSSTKWDVIFVEPTVYRI